MRVVVRCAALLLPALWLGGCQSEVVARSGTSKAASGKALAVGAVQGRGLASPLLGQEVTVRGVLRVDFSGQFSSDGDLGGWFLQDGGDGDEATSDGLYIAATPPPGLTRGMSAQVTGRVVELDGGGGVTVTTLQPTRVEILDERLPVPEAVVLRALPVDWERLEGMRVRIEASMRLLDAGELDEKGRLTVSFGELPRQPTDAAAPGPAAQAVEADNARRRFVLDDGRSGSPSPIARGLFPDGIAQARLGSTLSGAEGVVDHREGGYRLQLLSAAQLVAAERPAPPTVPGDVRIAALNLENFFNGDGRGGGFPTARGARSAEEFTAQRARHLATLRALDPDIVAVMELEADGNGPHSAAADLGRALGHDWRFRADDMVSGAEAPIRVGLFYRTSRVSAIGAPMLLRDGPFARHSRPPLAQAFRAGRGPVFVVVANHFKSKGCSEASGADADQGDGQVCWNATRLDSAQRLHAWLATDPTASGSDLTVLLGDFNAYSREDPIRALLAHGWHDALADVAAPYSYVYRGAWGRLDHALLSPALAPRLRAAAEWHSNADESDALGYRSNPNTDAGPWRSSDHDPLLLGFDLRRS